MLAAAGILFNKVSFLEYSSPLLPLPLLLLLLGDESEPEQPDGAAEVPVTRWGGLRSSTQ